jgi:hypothetical protein
MLNTYQAVLRDNRLEWAEKVPEHIKTGQAIPVHVTILDQASISPPVADRGRRMAEILERLAAINAFASINDPLRWEREMREDRPLPDRE